MINGDFVDLLADDDPGDGSLPPRPWTPDEGEALARLERVVAGSRTDGRGPFEALHDLVAGGGDLSAANPQAMLEKLQRLGDKIGDGLALLQQLAAGEDEDRLRRLHRALCRLNRADCFDLNRESEPYREAAAELLDSGRFSTVIFGHTHLPKAMNITTPSGHQGRYLNTGAWADVMRLPDEVLQAFPQARPALVGFLDDLLNNRHQQYVRRYLSWVEVRMHGEQVRDASLYSWCGEGREREAPLTHGSGG